MSDDPTIQTIKLARETMAGQLRDIMLDTMMHRASTLPWNMWTESEQQKFIDQVNERVEEAIRQAVDIIAADGRPVIGCNVEQFTVKDGIKIVLKSTMDAETLAIIGGLKARAAILTFAEPADYLGMTFRGPEPLQKELFVEDGEDKGEGDKPVFDQTAAGKTTRRRRGKPNGTGEPESQPEA